MVVDVVIMTPRGSDTIKNESRSEHTQSSHLLLFPGLTARSNLYAAAPTAAEARDTSEVENGIGPFRRISNMSKSKQYRTTVRP